MDTEITYESISEKLGFRPFFDDYDIQVSDFEDDSWESPFLVLSSEEMSFLLDYYTKHIEGKEPMIRLINIKKENHFFICDALLEDCMIPIHLEYDLEKRIITDYQLPDGYSNCREHISMARRYFDRVVSGEEKLKPEKLIMWY